MLVELWPEVIGVGRCETVRQELAPSTVPRICAGGRRTDSGGMCGRDDGQRGAGRGPLVTGGLRPETAIGHGRPAGGAVAGSGGLATDLDTKHRETDAKKGDGARQLGRRNIADLHL